jgi:hypothetical protein
MSDRILKTDLDHAVEHLNNITNHSQGYGIGRGRNGGWNVIRDGGWYISPVLPKRGLYQWLSAYTAGIKDGQKILTAKREG